MRKEQLFQCQSCGSLQKEKIHLNIDDLYIKMKCKCCGDYTKHLWVGDEDDLYMNYNVNVDPRYYKYNTK
jgi:transcription elongation factor Elf1